jgi:hypothetical protein
VIRFSAFLVAVAVALLVAGVVTSKLALVYVAIGVSGVALLALGAGALIKRNELFGERAPAEPEPARPGSLGPAVIPVPAAPPAPQVAPQVAPWEAAVPAAPAWPAAAAPPAPSRAGYLPTEQPPRPQPVKAPADPPADFPRRPAAFAPRPPAAPPWHADAPATQPLREVPRSSSAPPTIITPIPKPLPEPADESQPPVPQEPPDELPAEPPDEQPAAEDLTVQDQPAGEPEPPEPPEPSAESAESTEPATPEPEPATPEPAATPVDLQREVTVVPGVPRYHNPHCLLIRFMGEGDLDKMTLGAARDVGCTPCRACLPDQPEGDFELSQPEPERQVEIAVDVLPRRVGLRTRRRSDRARARPGLDRQHLIGDQPRVLGQGRDHLRVI